MKKVLKFLLYGVSGYLLLCVTVNLFPTNKPDFNKVFAPNTSYGNKQQGNEQVILGYKNGKVNISGVIKPFAEGPPEHVHTNFDEEFNVTTGALTLLVNRKKKVLNPGETFIVPRGTYHKWFNETDKEVVGAGDVPVGFAFTLNQLYAVSKENPEIFKSPKLLLQLAAWGSDFDSYLKDGPPPVVVKIIKFLLLPIAKISGYKYSNSNYFPTPITQKN